MSLFGDDLEIAEPDGLYDDLIGDDESSGVAPSKALCEPRASSACLGHDEQERLFLDLFEKGTIPHAMIFSGVEGIGKTTMAFRLARFLFKHGAGDRNQDALFAGDDLPVSSFDSLDVPADDPVFARIASGGHADLLHIERGFDSTRNKRDAALKVDALRKITPFLRKTSSEGGWRVVIIEDADTMNRNAQNAILKILEEPPSDVLIILVAHRVGALIPTIRSRARVIGFNVLPSEMFFDLLARDGHVLDQKQREIIYDLSQGSVGRALSYLNDGGLEFFETVMEHLADYPQWNWAKIHALSTSLSGPTQDKEYRLFSSFMQSVFRRILFSKARQENLPYYLDKPALQNYVNATSIEQLVTTVDALKAHFDRIEFSNLDRKDGVRGSFLVINER